MFYLIKFGANRQMTNLQHNNLFCSLTIAKVDFMRGNVGRAEPHVDKLRIRCHTAAGQCDTVNEMIRQLYISKSCLHTKPFTDYKRLGR